MRGEISFAALQQDALPAPPALARAIARGALGAGLIVRVEGETLRLSDGDGAAKGSLHVAGDRLRYELAVDETRAAAYASLLAAIAASLCAILFGWPWWWALPSGIAIGVAHLVANLRDQRRRWRSLVRALVENLPLAG